MLLLACPAPQDYQNQHVQGEFSSCNPVPLPVSCFNKWHRCFNNDAQTLSLTPPTPSSSQSVPNLLHFLLKISESIHIFPSSLPYFWSMWSPIGLLFAAFYLVFLYALFPFHSVLQPRRDISKLRSNYLTLIQSTSATPYQLQDKVQTLQQLSRALRFHHWPYLQTLSQVSTQNLLDNYLEHCPRPLLYAITFQPLCMWFMILETLFLPPGQFEITLHSLLVSLFSWIVFLIPQVWIWYCRLYFHSTLNFPSKSTMMLLCTCMLTCLTPPLNWQPMKGRDISAFLCLYSLGSAQYMAPWILKNTC